MKNSDIVGAGFLAVFMAVTATTIVDLKAPPVCHDFAVVSEDTLTGPIEIPKPYVVPVTVTIYHPVPEQTDSTPDITASGKKINIRKAGSYRIVAVSRDLLSRWGGPLSYGDVVYIDNAGSLSGWYVVEDTMHPRWKKRVDILRSPGAPLAKFNEAMLVMDKP